MPKSITKVFTKIQADQINERYYKRLGYQAYLNNEPRSITHHKPSEIVDALMADSTKYRAWLKGWDKAAIWAWNNHYDLFDKKPRPRGATI